MTPLIPGKLLDLDRLMNQMDHLVNRFELITNKSDK